MVAAWLGILFGLLDFFGWFLRSIATGKLVVWSDPHAVWLAPLALLTLFTIIVMPFAAAFAWLHVPLPLRAVASVLVALGSYGFLRSLRLGIRIRQRWRCWRWGRVCTPASAGITVS